MVKSNGGDGNKLAGRLMSDCDCCSRQIVPPSKVSITLLLLLLYDMCPANDSLGA